MYNIVQKEKRTKEVKYMTQNLNNDFILTDAFSRVRHSHKNSLTYVGTLNISLLLHRVCRGVFGGDNTRDNEPEKLSNTRLTFSRKVTYFPKSKNIVQSKPYII